MTGQAPVAGSNWAGNLTYRAARVHRPTSVEEVRRIVAGSERVKALGSRHCFNDIADTAADLVVLDGLDAPVRFDPADGAHVGAGTVRVPGGMRYGDLVPRLAEQGAALHNLASLPHITVVGATATGTHGSGNRSGSLSTSVTALELVRSDGEVVVLSEGEPDFPGAVVHLGALGVVTRVGLRFQPTFDVRNTVYLGLTWDRLFADFAAVADAAYSVFTDWREVTQVWVKSRTDEPEIHPEDFFGARAATEPTHMLPGTPVENLTEQLGVPGAWHERLPHFRTGFTPSRGEELQSEYFVPRQHGPAACDALRALAGRISPLLMVSEIRTVAADDLWLSPAYGTDVVALHFTWVPDEPRVRAVLPEVEEALRPFGARPHWGKLFTTDARELADLYPRLPDFRDLVRRCDPRGTFRNAYLDRTVAAHR